MSRENKGQTSTLLIKGNNSWVVCINYSSNTLTYLLAPQIAAIKIPSVLQVFIRICIERKQAQS